MALRCMNDHHDNIDSRLSLATLAYLRLNWPKPVHLSPARLGSEFSPENKAFIRIVQKLIDEGLLSVEFFLIGTGEEPIARDAILTRKGVAATLHL